MHIVIEYYKDNVLCSIEIKGAIDNSIIIDIMNRFEVANVTYTGF